MLVAVIISAAFSGFVAGRIVGLQEFGLGLAAAILVDATIVRVEPSPLEPQARPTHPSGRTLLEPS